MEHHKTASKVPAFLNVTDIAGKFTTFVIRAAMSTSKAVNLTLILFCETITVNPERLRTVHII